MSQSMPRRAQRRGKGEGLAAKVSEDAKQGGTAPERRNLYDEVTAKIIHELEGGRFPWVQPWAKAGEAGSGVIAPGLPRNALSARPYSGVNILILWSAVIEQGFATQSWLTFRQALEAGGSVRKGERGTSIVYADRFVPKTEAARAAQDGDDAKTVPFLKRFTVFNVAQCEGLRPGLASDPEPLAPREIVPVAEQLIRASGADFRIGGDKAYYVPSHDYIAVPPQTAFYESVNFYRTALHELTHWSGHKSRLARDFTGAFGSSGYAREELTAEMGGAFLCAALGIVPTVRLSDYIGSWLDVLRADNRAIFRAASAASKAADYLLDFQNEAKGDALDQCAKPQMGGQRADMQLRSAA